MNDDFYTLGNCVDAMLKLIKNAMDEKRTETDLYSQLQKLAIFTAATTA